MSTIQNNDPSAQHPISGGKQQYTLTVYAEDHIGLLSRICIIFSRRKINIDSLNTSSSEVDGIHRFNILIDETEEVVKKLCKQIEKQVEVLRAFYNTNNEIVWQELALYKVPTKEVAEKMVVERILRKYGARVVCVRPDFTVFESTGHTEDTEELVKKLGEYNLVEFVRGARVAIMKESEGFHKRLKEFEYKEPGEEVIENEFLEQGENIFTM